MLEQAEERSKKSYIYDLKQKRKKALIWTMSQVGFTLLNIVNVVLGQILLEEFLEVVMKFADKEIKTQFLKFQKIIQINYLK